jgi:hypothetical protein
MRAFFDGDFDEPLVPSAQHHGVIRLATDVLHEFRLATRAKHHGASLVETPQERATRHVSIAGPHRDVFGGPQKSPLGESSVESSVESSGESSVVSELDTLSLDTRSVVPSILDTLTVVPVVLDTLLVVPVVLTLLASSATR